MFSDAGAGIVWLGDISIAGIAGVVALIVGIEGSAVGIVTFIVGVVALMLGIAGIVVEIVGAVALIVGMVSVIAGIEGIAAGMVSVIAGIGVGIVVEIDGVVALISGITLVACVFPFSPGDIIPMSSIEVIELIEVLCDCELCIFVICVPTLLICVDPLFKTISDSWLVFTGKSPP